jgi:hypothetical protein
MRQLRLCRLPILNGSPYSARRLITIAKKNAAIREGEKLIAAKGAGKNKIKKPCPFFISRFF